MTAAAILALCCRSRCRRSSSRRSSRQLCEQASHFRRRRQRQPNQGVLLRGRFETHRFLSDLAAASAAATAAAESAGRGLESNPLAAFVPALHPDWPGPPPLDSEPPARRPANAWQLPRPPSATALRRTPTPPADHQSPPPAAAGGWAPHRPGGPDGGRGGGGAGRLGLDLLEGGGDAPSQAQPLHYGH
jgi:hypothetical protein